MAAILRSRSQLRFAALLAAADAIETGGKSERAQYLRDVADKISISQTLYYNALG
jgi:hypothetical protein